MKQQTLKHSFTLEGVGIHTGAQGKIVVHPAESDSGRVFRLGELTLPALAEYVIDTARCTTLGRDGSRVSTVEHLLSALYGCGIDNALIVVDGPEIPILDGSALPFVEAIRAAGTQLQDAPAKGLWLTEQTWLQEGESEMRATPAEAFTLEARTEFADWPEGDVELTARIGPEWIAEYAETIAPARTFAFRQEVEMLMKAGLAKGGSLDNALIISPPDEFSSALRLPSEWCAHKMLDIIGDLALLGARLHLKVTAKRPGHRLNVNFAKVLRDHCYEQA